MNRQEKKEEVARLEKLFESATDLFLVNYKGLNVPEAEELRDRIREADSGFRVVKNSLALRALKDTFFEDLSNSFTGPTAVAYNREDNPVLLAKALDGYMEDSDKLKVKAGKINGEVVEEQKMRELAQMPSPGEIKSRLLGTLKAGASEFVNLLGTPPRDFVSITNQKSEEDNS